MLKTNIGRTDRVLRIALGAALLLAFVLGPQDGWQRLYLIGVIPLATGLLGTCPIYTALGIDTCRLRP